MADIVIPAELLPRDGRFGSGPAKIRQQQVDVLASLGSTLLGTSHRQPPVKNLVAQIQANLLELFEAPAGYEVLLSNGGASFFWDSATFHLIRERSLHAQAGEFGAKFSTAVAKSPHLATPVLVEAEPGTAALPQRAEGVDLYAWAHNETSTGVLTPVQRIDDDAALTVVDGTSAAGGVPIDISQTDAYYFSGQKNFSADGGIWFAVVSPAAIERIEELGSRWAPQSLALPDVVANSRANQTLNTPALSTLILMHEQLQWFLENGGLSWSTGRSATSSGLLYDWAADHEVVSPFVTQREYQSPVVVTLEFADHVPAAKIAQILRAHGIIDVEPYRKLGRNQLRVATFPSVDPSDVQALIASIDYVLAQLL